MAITSPDIERYMHGLLPARDAVLSEMESEAVRRGIPIVGPAVGRLLAQYVIITGAKRIFELGSAIGYSTIWMARAAGPSAEVHYSDASEANALEARSYIERAGVGGTVELHVGDALAALARTTGDFDIIFNDVDKEGYLAVLEAAPARLRTGGLLLTDNTLWHERVLAPTNQADRAVVEFNRRLSASKEFFTTLIPLRDGVSVAVKL